MSAPFHWLDLAGRTYVVTGAASGIGLAVAESLVRVGAHVALVDRDGAGAERAAQHLRDAGRARHGRRMRHRQRSLRAATPPSACAARWAASSAS